MNSLTRMWLTWRHRGKFQKLGRRCQFPIPRLTVEGHVVLGDLGRFRDNVTLRAYEGAKIIFSSRSGCSWGCLVEAASEIRIGQYTAIAEYSVISDVVTGLWGSDVPPRNAKRVGRPISIGPDCFVGSGCYIGPGVTIGRGAVIGPYSVVLRDVGDFEIWTGLPARKIGHRTENVPASRVAQLKRLVSEQGIMGDRYRDAE